MSRETGKTLTAYAYIYEIKCGRSNGVLEKIIQFRVYDNNSKQYFGCRGVFVYLVNQKQLPFTGFLSMSSKLCVGKTQPGSSLAIIPLSIARR